MTYNMSFLIAAVIFLLLILYHFLNSRKLDDENSRIFSFFIVLGLADILFDIGSTILISNERPDLSGATMLVTTIFYLLQVLVPYALYLYASSLCAGFLKEERGLCCLCSLPALAMGVLVLGNIWSGIFFYIDQNGSYIKGPVYLGMYIYAIGYGVVILINSLVHYRKLGSRKFGIICEFLIIMAVCVCAQALRNEILMTGFGLGLGILVLYLTINNPSGYLDMLTKTFNFQSFLSWIQGQIAKKRNFHILTVELHHLDQLNKLFGMDIIDVFICRITEQLSEILGSQYLFRISGRRFVLVTHSLSEYERVRDELLKLFSGNLRVGDEQIPLAAVISGIIDADKMEDSDDLVDYIRYLSTLVPASNETTLVQSNDNTMKGFRYKKEIERYLCTAIEEDLFEVYYQPVFSVEEKKYVSLEALSRLRHPVYGPISPEIFIQIAEDNGQIRQIGQLQFRKVCRFVREHPELMSKIQNVKFNLSPVEILWEECSERLISLIREYDLPFSFFQFEITETTATEYNENLYRIVEDFKQYEISMSLDDFGCGYANLEAVLKLPFSSIKMDRTLLTGIMEDEKALLFYGSIVAMLQKMGYSVVAEGVEHKREYELLTSCGVDMIQGYYFSTPVSPADLLLLLAE